MPELFRRSWSVQIGTVRISGVGAGGGAEQAGLDCSFEIEKSLEREPNTLSLKIWNLSPTHRRAIEGTRDLAVRVEGGYVDSTTILFDGDVRLAQNRRGGRGIVVQGRDVVDVVSEIEAEDGGRAYREATVQQAFTADTPVASVLRAAISALGIGEGNLRDIGDVTIGDLRGYTLGTVLSGLAHRELDRIVRSCGLTWSIQSGVLQLRGSGALRTTAVLLSPGSGLVGSPSRDAEGYVSAVSLLNGGLYPGRPVVLESRDVSGSFAVHKVRHTGDTAGPSWYSEATLAER